MTLWNLRAYKIKGHIIAKDKYQFTTLLLFLALILSAFPFLEHKLSSSVYFFLFYWGGLITVIYFLFPAIHVPGRIRLSEMVKGYAVSGAVIYIAFGFIIGVLMRSLKGTPYDLSPFGIFRNLIMIFPALIAREMIRSYGIGTVWSTLKRRRMMVVFITIIIALTEINFTKVQHFRTLKDAFIYVACDVIPIFTRSGLQSVLVFYGGVPAGIAYSGVIQLFEKCFPILPDLPWLAKSAIGVVMPTVTAIYIDDKCRAEMEDRIMTEKQGGIGYAAALLIAVMFSWFCVGVFSVYPSIVLTGSMEPEIYPGDVVLIRKMLEEEDIDRLVKGDVINFQQGTINITHRIQEVITDEAGNLSFVTKGDNNKSEDVEPVVPNNIRGIVVRVVPKVGLPVLIMRSQEEVPEGVIDNDKEILDKERQQRDKRQCVFGGSREKSN